MAASKAATPDAPPPAEVDADASVDTEATEAPAVTSGPVTHALEAIGAFLTHIAQTHPVALTDELLADVHAALGKL